MRDVPERTLSPGRWMAVVQGSRVAAQRYVCSPWRVRLQLLRVLASTGVGPREALRSGLADPRLPRHCLDGVISKARLVALQRRVNPDVLFTLTGDKARFDLECRARRLPVPLMLAVLRSPGDEAGDGVSLEDSTAWDHLMRGPLPPSMMLKPARGGFGVGALLLTRQGDGFVDEATGRHLSATALCDHLRRSSQSWVLQSRLESHAAVVRLSGSRFLETVRMTTVLDDAGRAQMPYANFKLIVGRNVVDNFRHGRTGNLIANVSSEGRLSAGMTVGHGDVGVEHVPIHPSTGMPIEGFELPDWQEAVALVCRAAEAFHPLRTLGWDVALTPTGPVLVEANHFWDPVPILLAGPQAPGVARHGMVTMLEWLRRAGGSA